MTDELGKIENLRVSSFEPVQTPASLKAKLAISPKAQATVVGSRQAVQAAICGEDPRLVLIVGPCSIHDPVSARDYASRLARVAAAVADRFIVVMRVYFEKPRTTLGWKGLINDPGLDSTFAMDRGFAIARELLIDINAMGLPCATEFLDPVVPQYTADLVSWAAIGARTAESQTHREMASGLSMPVGFKNATDGSVEGAIDAMTAARHAHAFLGVDPTGRTSVVRTTGNPDVHLVLRGGGRCPNYSRAHIAYVKVLLDRFGGRRILVDCSHGNSNKDPDRQPDAFQEALAQHLAGEAAILGMMLESNIEAGRQDVGKGKLVYGKSITDACMSWDATEKLLMDAYGKVR
ncbi:MAG: 3-deoxy-7-phosphoheptulonate synthase [Deltaproteobacteria bacterium]|nr:3-deoxy-7-phosphoheptulonate synthase [Deltaproteobacteria bacterium]